MGYAFPSQIERLVREHMATGRYATEDELLFDALRSLVSEQEEHAAIQAGIDSLERGEEGVSLDEAFESVRSRDVRRANE